MIRRLLVVAGLLPVVLLAGCGGGPSPVPFALGTVHRDLRYCNAQRLDLYIPRRAADRALPVAMYVHGGGLTAGDKSNLNPVFLHALASHGYAVASINYRLAPDAHFPAQIEDVKCAIRYVRATASRYGLDQQQIFAFGTSAGGQLAALAALTGPRAHWDVGAYPSESSNLAAVADLFGPANLTEPASGYSPTGIQQVFGRADHRDLALASPTHYVAPGSPPVLLVQGTEDTTVLPSQSTELYRDLQARGDPAQLIRVEHMGHMFTQVGTDPFRPGLGQIADDVVGFFDRALRVCVGCSR